MSGRVIRKVPPGAVLRMNMSSWSGFESTVHMPIEIKPLPGCIGYCEVFESAEALLNQYPGAQFMPIKQAGLPTPKRRKGGAL